MQRAAAAGAMAVQADMTPHAGVAGSGEPEARLHQAIHHLAGGDAERRVGQGAGLLQLELHLVGVQIQPGKGPLAQPQIAESRGAAHAALADEAVVVREAWTDLLHIHMGHPVRIAVPPAHPGAMALLSADPLDLAVFAQRERGGR
ncbi:hypothetical protein DIZ40_17070, partial [Legionella pneumophila]